MLLRIIDFLQDGQEGTKRVTYSNALKNDTQVDRYTAGPSTSERKPALKRSRELSPAKPKLAHSCLLHKRQRFINNFHFIDSKFAVKNGV